MSELRRKRRQQEREAIAHMNVLGDLLMGFYAFLEQKNKPSNEAVRAEFIKRESQWKRYCASNKLNDSAALLFNQEVAVSWESRYTKPISDTMTQN